MERRDLSAFKAIQMRVVLDSFETANAKGQPLSLRLRDTSRKAATVTLPVDIYALLFPATIVKDADKAQPYIDGIAPLTKVNG